MSSRPERLGDQVRAELAQLLHRLVRDPALRLVTVTHVRMTRDLQHARIFYTTLAAESERPQTARGLLRAAPFLRSQLGRRIRFRRVPELTFVYDDSLEREQRVAAVLESLQRDTSATAEESPPSAPADTDE
jgi:ribosome-binding factor A